MRLKDYGISIPIYDVASKELIKRLKGNPKLKNRITDWLTDIGTERIVREDLSRVHSQRYVETLFSEELEKEIIRTYELLDEDGNFHRYDPSMASLPLEGLLQTVLNITAGTYKTGKIALKTGFCFFIGGGMHHAHTDYGSGFCPINDVVIAVRKLMHEGPIRTAWIIDVDAHKGDGTAELTYGDDSIRTLSIHMAAGWPLDGKEYDDSGILNPAFIPSDIDIPIGFGEDYAYNRELALGLDRLAAFPSPDIAYVVSGADPWECDELPSSGGLSLTLEQLHERDEMIYRFLRKQRIPAAYCNSGGYSPDAWRVYKPFLEKIINGG